MTSTIDEPAYTFEIDMSLGGTFTTVVNVLGFSFNRGRQDELGTIEAGRLDIAFANNGDWSKLNPSGPFPYYTLPYWLLRPCRLTCTYDATTYHLFYGYITDWTPQLAGPLDGEMRVIAYDYLYALHLVKPSATLPQQTVDARIAAILDEVSTQPGETLARSLDAGKEDALAATLTGQATALGHIQEVLAGERGIFFQAGDGTLVYHNRHHRFVTASGYTSQATFGQANLTTGVYAAGVLPYVAGQPSLDDQRIYNTVVVTASGAGETGTATNGTSAGLYWPRTLPVSAPWLPAGHAQSLAEWLLYVYKDEYYRLPALTVEPTTAAAWAQALGREIGDRLTISINGPGALTFVRDAWIEGVRMAWDKGSGHTTAWQLSDAESLGPTPFRLGISALNSGHVLIY